MKYDLSRCKWQVKGYYPWVPVKDKSMETGKELQGITDWIPAKVPGGVHYDLYKAGLIPYPYKDLNSLQCEWVEKRWWLYQTELDTSKLPQASHYRLVFEGLDYKARIFLGDAMIGEHEGMYEPIEIPITEAVRKSGKLLLKVLFFHAPDEMGQIGMTSQTHTQKSRFNYKWDFGTRLVNIGIWNSCYIRCEKQGCMENLHIISDHQNQKGYLKIQGAIRWNETAVPNCQVHCSITLDDQNWKLKRNICGNQFQGEVEIDAPRLWYPNGYGEQPLYQIKVSLLDGGEEIDHREFQVGIRSIAYRQNEESPADALPYTFVINGRKIYIKGVNMTPLDHIYGNVTAEHYEHMTELMRRMNVNLVRIWGGGLIEQEAFYQACDKKGIMVWQEFIQSSSGIDNVPSQKPEFLALLRKTAECAVTRIRNHTSLAAWSGGNELTDEQGVPATYDDKNVGMLKKIANTLDPQRIFFPTSASGPREFISLDKGVSHDVHGDWNYYGDESFYQLNRQSDSLFHSEFGAEGMCSVRSLKRFLSPEQLKVVPASESMVYRHHGEWWCGFERDRKVFGECRNIWEMAVGSAWLQAEGLRFILESNRRRKFHNSGSIIWQINEPWPNVFCTNLVDYYQEAKMAYYWAKNAFSELTVSMDYKKLGYQGGEQFKGDIYIGREIGETEKDYKITCEIQDMKGNILHAQGFCGIIQEERMVLAGRLEFLLPQSYEGIFAVNLQAGVGELICRNQYFFGCGEGPVYKAALRLEDTSLECCCIQTSDSFLKWQIRNVGAAAALHIHPYTEQEFNLICDTSYVTLMPGEETLITVSYSPKFSSGFLEAAEESAKTPDIQFAYLNQQEASHG